MGETESKKTAAEVLRGSILAAAVVATSTLGSGCGSVSSAQNPESGSNVPVVTLTPPREGSYGSEKDSSDPIVFKNYPKEEIPQDTCRNIEEALGEEIVSLDGVSAASVIGSEQREVVFFFVNKKGSDGEDSLIGDVLFRQGDDFVLKTYSTFLNHQVKDDTWVLTYETLEGSRSSVFWSFSFEEGALFPRGKSDEELKEEIGRALRNGRVTQVVFSNPLTGEGISFEQNGGTDAPWWEDFTRQVENTLNASVVRAEGPQGTESSQDSEPTPTSTPIPTPIEIVPPVTPEPSPTAEAGEKKRMITYGDVKLYRDADDTEPFSHLIAGKSFEVKEEEQNGRIRIEVTEENGVTWEAWTNTTGNFYGQGETPPTPVPEPTSEVGKNYPEIETLANGRLVLDNTHATSFGLVFKYPEIIEEAMRERPNGRLKIVLYGSLSNYPYAGEITDSNLLHGFHSEKEGETMTVYVYSNGVDPNNGNHREGFYAFINDRVLTEYLLGNDEYLLTNQGKSEMRNLPSAINAVRFPAAIGIAW